MIESAPAVPVEAAEERRNRGVFYTPAPLAAALARWAVRPSSRRILDPAFGDGALLQAAVAQLRTARVRTPGRRVWGVEFDAQGLHRVAARNLGIPSQQLLVGDFLAHDLSAFAGKPFDAILGNPPYVRHHRLAPSTRAWGLRRAAEAGIALSARSDAWAYFCAHLMSFLSPDGRLGVLLPGSVLHADYALPLLHALGAGAGHTHLIRLQRLQFQDVQERTVVLLVDRSVPGQGEVEYREVADVGALERLLASRALSGRRRVRRSSDDADLAIGGRLATRLRWHLRSAEATAWAAACAHPHVGVLGDLASVRIGVVTGANKWFIRRAAEAEALGAAHVPVVSRAAWLDGLSWEAGDETAFPERKSRLLTLTAGDDGRAEIRGIVADGEKQELHLRHHCSNRTPWWSLTDVRRPDFFLPYMGARARGLVLNGGTATCTNAIHRVWLKPGSPGAAAVSVASWTSLWRLSLELHGRSYGGGVLKIEPGEAIHLRVPILPSEPAEVFARVADCWRCEGEAAARELADRLVLEDGLGLTASQVAALRAAAVRLEARRAS